MKEKINFTIIGGDLNVFLIIKKLDLITNKKTECLLISKTQLDLTNLLRSTQEQENKNSSQVHMEHSLG